jgi:hypothetical protein
MAKRIAPPAAGYGLRPNPPYSPVIGTSFEPSMKRE